MTKKAKKQSSKKAGKAKAGGKTATKKVRSKKSDGDLPAPPRTQKTQKTQTRRQAGQKTRQAGQKPKRVSALDAAAQVLKAAGKPMRAQELITAMAEQNLWKSPGGKTPHATLYAAMLREIGAKGEAARFTKTDRGQFAYNG